MLWRENQKWIGPLKVVTQEDHNVIWLSMGNRLCKAAPEQIRPVTAVEETELKDKASQESTGYLRMPQNFRDVTNETFPQSSFPATGPESQNLSENGPQVLNNQTMTMNQKYLPEVAPLQSRQAMPKQSCPKMSLSLWRAKMT